MANMFFQNMSLIPMVPNRMAGLYACFRPLIFRIDPERMHRWTICALKNGRLSSGKPSAYPILHQELWGREFRNPIGLAAGFDKDAEVPAEMLALGFGFTEIGSVTPRPQAGNPKPRLFRLAADEAVINRMGFNNGGMSAAARRLASLPSHRVGPVGVNVGMNQGSSDAAADYVACIAALGPFADYIVVNVSSPNTPGLRALQDKAPLQKLLRAAKQAVGELYHQVAPPLLLKVAPDLTSEDIVDIAEVALDEGVDGLIATNTTIERPSNLTDPHASEAGGLSGRPLKIQATKVLADFYKLTGGQLPLIGVGGIGSGDDAYARIRAGASLVQLYSAMVYQGPGIARQICQNLAELLKRDGFSSISEAIGADHQ